jgi:hypothetical protein
MSASLSAQVYYENDSGGQFTDDLTITDGDYYWYVDADEASVIDMVGGIVDELIPFGFSTTNISGGLTQNLEALEAATINISAGEVLDLSAYDQSEVSITGGDVSWLYLTSGSQAIMLEGDIENLWAESFSTVDIYGYDISYEPQHSYDGTRQTWEGLLTGFWQNQAPFSIATWDQETYDHVVLHDLGALPSAPEPATLLLLGLGALAIRRRG